MVVCGISGRRRGAAAALAVDGRLVAAASEGALVGVPSAGYGGAAWPVAAVEACLSAAGLAEGDITHVVRAEGAGASLALRASAHPRLGGAPASPPAAHRVSRLAAHVQLARAAGATRILVADGASAALVEADGPAGVRARGQSVLALAPRLAAALGLTGADGEEALGALEQLAAGADGTRRPWCADLAASGSVEAAFEAAVAAARAEAGVDLADRTTPLVRAARVRADVAASFLDVLAGQFGGAARSEETMLAGSVFGVTDFAARVAAAAGRPCPVAPCAWREGAAAGAALAPLAVDGAWPESLALGAAATEPEAKAVLENCRLDYLYEPRWPRLLERVSRLLERGKLVAWFQGPAEFGHPLYGSRSILCDPSSRYARDNVNVFLRGCALAAPIPVSFGHDTRGLVDAAPLSPWALARTTVHADARESLRAVVDPHGRVHAHVLAAGARGPFADLLALHHQRTGVPGLVNLPLSGPGDAPAVTPRDAVRAAFASSVDALVIHRFVVMKDYWQMHAGAR